MKNFSPSTPALKRPRSSALSDDLNGETSVINIKQEEQAQDSSNSMYANANATNVPYNQFNQFFDNHSTTTSGSVDQNNIRSASNDANDVDPVTSNAGFGTGQQVMGTPDEFNLAATHTTTTGMLDANHKGKYLIS